MSATKRVLYLDPFSGIAGDMLVGALLDLGLDLEHLRRELRKLKLDGYELAAESVLRGGLRATHFRVLVHAQAEGGHAHAAEDEHAHGHTHPGAHQHGRAHGREHSHVHEPPPRGRARRGERPAEARAKVGTPDAGSQKPEAVHGHAHRSFAEIRKLIESSGLSARVKEQSLKAFRLLAEAEGRMHGKDPEQVNFHEVGAVDSIVDFVGACIGLEALGVEEVWCGPVALGGEVGRFTESPGEHAQRSGRSGGSPHAGYVRCAHGLLPIPAPATLELLKGVPLRSCPVAAELTTPTGAALVKALAVRFGPLPPLCIKKLGYGAGTRNDPAIPVPNILRVVLGTLSAGSEAGSGGGAGAEADTVIEFQANVDDATPEVLGYLADRLLALGALDVFFTAVQMKKTRPGTLVTVLCEPARFDALAEALFRESPTFGLRYELKSRLKLAREVRTVKTPWGEVRVKLGRWRGETVSVHPEYEDCRALAERHGVPLRQVLDAARTAQ
jgi:hypothetical protein